MNALNRLVMLVIALLLLVIPVLILLVAFGVIPAQAADTYTGYQGAADAIGGFSLTSISNTGRIIAGVVSAIVALVALILLFRELSPGRRAARRASLNRDAGKETRITGKAVRSLAAGAARQAGGISPSVSLSSRKGAYMVGTRITAPETSNHTEVAERAREMIRQTLDDQGVPTREVEVTVEGIAPDSGPRNT